MLTRAFLPSMVGRLTLVASDAGLRAVLWENDRPERVPLGRCHEDADHPVLREVRHQLDSYFAGRLKTFDLPLNPVGTPFQRRVWDALARIPFGQTRTYGAIAADLGNPKSVRAVGAANGRNPISIVVPCHRVIGASGSLVGFAGGLDVKTKLLALEEQGQADLFPSFAPASATADHLLRHGMRRAAEG